MTKEQLDKANELTYERDKVEAEIVLWVDQITDRSSLGYLQTWNNDHCVPLKSRMPEDLFRTFRSFIITSLRGKLEDIDREFENL